MRILFYLPAPTPNWFYDNIGPLIRAAVQAGAEVHVVITPLWNGTGITNEHLARYDDLIATVKWHVLDGPDHPSLRTRPDNPDAVVALAQQINADYTFCRSADLETPARFPGKVRFFMEAEFSPVVPASTPESGRIMLTGPRLYDFGFMPDLGEVVSQKLRGAIQQSWDAVGRIAGVGSDRAAYLEKTGLPDGRTIIAVPLQCQTPDNVFGIVHSSENPVDEWVSRIVESGDDDWLIAVALHPIDRRHANTNGAIGRIAQMDPNRVRIVDYPGERYRGEASERLIQHCDGLVVAESKVISIATYFEKPILRLSPFATAPWVRAYTDMATFRQALASGAPATAAPADTQLWFAYHYANQAFVGEEASLAELIERVEKTLIPGAWARGIDRLHLQFPGA